MATRVRMGLRAPVELAGGRMEWRPRRHVDGADVVLPEVIHVALAEGVETFAEIPAGVWWVDEFVAEAGASRVVLVPDTEETVNYADLVDVDPATLDPVGPPPVDAWEAALGDAVHEATERADGFASAAGGHALAAGGSAISAAESVRLAAAEVLAAAGQVALAMQQVTAAAGHAGDADSARAAAVTAQQGAVTAREAIEQLRPELTVGGLVVGRDLVLRRADGAEAVAGQVVPNLLAGTATGLTPGSTPTVGIRKEGLDFYVDLGVPAGTAGGLPFNGTVAPGTSCNDLAAAGRSQILTATGATVALGYPFDGFTGVIDSLPVNGNGQNNSIQKAYPYGASQASRLEYTRRKINATSWADWVAYSAFSTSSPEGSNGKNAGLFDPNTNTWLNLAIAGLPLGDMNLDLLTEPGSYGQLNSGTATTERNYPATNRAFLVEVMRQVSGNTVIVSQQAMACTGGTANRGYWIRRGYSSTGIPNVAWTAWQFIASQRIDKTAGLAIFTFDEVAQREQLVYADTGTRDVTSLAVDAQGASLVTTGSVWIERDARHVTIQLQNLGLRDAGTVDLPVVVPGFRSIGGANALVGGGATPVPRRLLSVGTNLRIYGGAAGEILNGTIAYRVHDAYPVGMPLPGTAINTPPNV